MDTLVEPLDRAFVDVDGRRVEAFDTGSSPVGAPVVVLLTGAGDTARSWLPLQTLLSRTTRVISYERSGIGASAPGSPRTIDGLVAELEGVIAALAPHSPVLLVGHSFGALIARVFTARHPARVAGLVMLDATPDLLASDPVRRRGYRFYVGGIAAARRMLPAPLFARLVRRNTLPLYPGRGPFLAALQPRARDEWHSAVVALFLGDAVAEMRAVLPGTVAAAAELADAVHGDLPVALITSGTYGRGWITMHDAVASRYPNATHHLSGDRFHNVHMRHFGQIAGTVRAMLDRASGDPHAR
ncbi:pimeloyl-ACP methyl ester carboxylesterase [Microbacterium sp. AG1240]|uniref:alpha/beta fold hydrolase n=1 Tax=Microbacterium sp. AG1240 TaxID=2183992 RepID=UPI000EAE5480|nr:alpha/beta hydrolase [Microbacterium sp. AG1240]RKT36326.1 pimeloyl-ACP methyl ester carboxylesterase [Microbacterium sp. AG1240]